ncbi:MAG: flippase activity-associated protein Agl23 [Candidatus Promineifilaceae bacterium]
MKEQEQIDWLDKPLSVAIQIDWEKALYIAFIVIAIVSRFYGLGDRVVSHDESLHTQYSYQFYIGDGYTHTPLMHGPFLFHVTAASYWLFGDGDFAARIPVALFGVLMVVLPYFMRDWIGRKGALFASFMLLISPYLTYYSRYIRHDIYVIVWAMIIFIATLYYLRERQDKYLWWIAAAIAMMYNTKEVSFIYVAIFGSFLIVRLLAKLFVDVDFRQNLSALMRPMLMLGGSIILVGVGGIISLASGGEEGEVEAAVEAVASTMERTGDLILFSGMILVGVALFLAVRAVRTQLERYAEYDLIMLYATLLLPTLSALLISQLGLDPRSYTLNSCQLPGEAEMTSAQVFFGRLISATCWSSFFSSSIVGATLVTLVMLVLGLVVGWWWGGRRFLVPAIIFHALFAFFYTSVFTNTGGWYSGMVGSLAYWLDQQEVARGGQPPFYYLIVTPLYEFLPILFSFFAMQLWLAQRKLKPYVSFIVGALLITYLNYSFVSWLFTRVTATNTIGSSGAVLIAVFIIGAIALRGYVLTQADAPSWAQSLADGMSWVAYAALLTAAANYLPFNSLSIDTITPPSLLSNRLTWIRVGTVVPTLAICGYYWLFIYLPRADVAQTEETWAERLDADDLFGFVPHVVWWTVLTWIAYSWAGEKMPWLSTHIAVPTILLAGYYFGQKLKNVSYAEFFNGRQLALLGMAMGLLLIGFITVQTLLLEVQFGDQSLGALQNVGAFFGRIASLIALIFVWRYLRQNSPNAQRQRAWILATFLLLSLLTIRFTYMANYVNGDSSNEFLVYAHGHPATKQQVLRQLEELSTRLEGDKSVRVSFDNKSSWPYYWYLRDYTNQHFFGETPDASITDSPVILAGSDKWEQIDNIVRDDYVVETYSYIWWPMEEYRNVSWTSVLGIEEGEQQRGLGSQDVRQALWDIFFYRDYEQYEATFGGTYTTGQWPLRSDLRMYIRRDVLGTLWDSGLTANTYRPAVDPYAAGEVFPAAEITFGESGSAEGQLLNPRNVAVADDGRVYVADTGNHRIQVFNTDGSAAFTIGEFGSEPGQINEPWGLTTDANFLYVADTWNGRIQKFTLDGDFVMTFGRFEIPAEGSLGELQFYGPRSIDVHDGQLYIMDTGNHRVQIVDTEGNYISQVGSKGFTLGQFSEPVGLAIDDKGFIYVAEAWNRRIQQLNEQLVGFFEWEVDAWEGNSLDNKPYIALDESNGRVYVTDPEGHQVLIFNTIGEYLGRFGRFGTDSQSFNLPTGIAVDNDGNVYVVDSANNRVEKFRSIELSAVEAPLEDVLNSGGSSDQ